MPTILNIDAGGRVIDCTVGSLAPTFTEVLTPAVPAVEPQPTDLLDVAGQPIMTEAVAEVPAATQEVTRTAAELGAPSRDGCTQAILTDAQEAAYQAAVTQPNGGLTFDGTAFSRLPVPATPGPNPLIAQVKAATDVASLQAVLLKMLGG